MSNKKLSRRDFLRGAAIVAGGTALAACATPTPETIKETVEVAVEKTVEVEVEKTVKEYEG